VSIAGDIPSSLLDWWDDFARSLRRRGRSEATTRIYGQSYTRFWHCALAEGLPPDHGAVSTAYVNRWVDSLVGGRRNALIARRIAHRDRCTS
jgi:hypothetical protein